MSSRTSATFQNLEDGKHKSKRDMTRSDRALFRTNPYVSKHSGSLARLLPSGPWLQSCISAKSDLVAAKPLSSFWAISTSSRGPSLSDAPPIATVSLDKVGKGYGQQIIPDEGVAMQNPNVGNPSESQAWIFARIRTESAHLRPQLSLHPLPVRKSTCSHLLERPRPASNFEYICQITAEIVVRRNIITLPS